MNTFPNLGDIAWQADTYYKIGQIASYSGVLYICTTAHQNSQPPSANWAAYPKTSVTISTGKGLSGGGDLSADRTLTWAPAYSAATTYAVGDLVTYNGNIYACIQAGTNQTPAFPSTSYWVWIWSLDVTVSTSDPSGTPGDGDIWIKRES
jgi:hypothetical protein